MIIKNTKPSDINGMKGVITGLFTVIEYGGYNENVEANG